MIELFCYWARNRAHIYSLDFDLKIQFSARRVTGTSGKGPWKAVVVCIQHWAFNNFGDTMIKLSVNKTKINRYKNTSGAIEFTLQLCPLQVFRDGREVSISSRSTARDSWSVHEQRYDGQGYKWYQNEYERLLQLCCLFADVAKVIRFILCPL